MCKVSNRFSIYFQFNLETTSYLTFIFVRIDFTDEEEWKHYEFEYKQHMD
jgi:hypothetical protein